MFNLRREIKDYLELNDLQVESVFSKFDDHIIHMAFSRTFDYYEYLPNKIPERRKLFKQYLKQYTTDDKKNRK